MNRMSVLVVSIVVVLVASQQVPARAQSNEPEWVRLLRQEPQSAQALEVLGEQIGLALKEESDATAHCIAAVADPDSPPRIRQMLVTVLIESDRVSTLNALLSVIAADLDDVEQVGKQGEQARSRVESALRGLSTNPRVTDLREDKNLVDLLDWGSRHGYEFGGRERFRYELIQRAPVDARTKSRLLCNAILTPHGAGAVDCKMDLGLLNDEDRENLREVVRSWAGDLASYPSNVTWALLVLGDEQTLEIVRGWSENASIDDRIRARVAELLAMGEARRDPTAALSFLESGGLPASGEAAACVLESAVAFGIDLETLRSALSARERQVSLKAVEMGKTERAQWVLRCTWLWPVKSTAVRLGVLKHDEWPDISADPLGIAGLATP